MAFALKPSSLTMLLLSITFILLLFLLFGSNEPTGFHRYHRRLKLRMSNSGGNRNRTAFVFDPLIANFEREIEDRQFNSNRTHYEDLTEWEEYMRAENYINDEGRFNITDRIIELFPLIDVDPTDGHVSAGELATWHLNQDAKSMLHRTEREMELHDGNKDGFVSYEEYESSRGTQFGGVVKNGDKEGWWKEDHFNASDIDQNGLLNLTDFNEFLNPSEESNPELIKWLCKQIIRERDTNKDGKLDLKEFFADLYDKLSIDEDNFTDDSAKHSKEWKAKHLFVQLDANLDGYLSEDEMVPVLSKLHPSESHYVKDHVDYIMSVADQDKDGYLSLKEMIDNQFVFYGSIYEDEDDLDDYHDEFR